MLLAASAFVRPVSYYLPLVVSAIVLFAAVRDRGLWRPLGLATSFFMVCALPLGAWQVRNWKLAEYPGFSAIVENGLYFYQQAAVTAALEDRPLEVVQAEMGIVDPQGPLRQHPEWQGLSAGELHVHMGAEAKRVIRQHPLTYAKNHLRNIFRLLITPGSGDIVRLTGNFGRQERSATEQAVARGRLGYVAAGGLARIATAMILSGIAVTYMFLAAYGILQPTPARLRWTMIAIAAYFWVVTCLPQAAARLRHPLMPLLCLLAAQGVAALVARVQSRRSRRQCRKRTILTTAPRSHGNAHVLLDQRHQLFEIDRLGQHVQNPGLDGRIDNVDRRMAGQENTV